MTSEFFTQTCHLAPIIEFEYSIICQFISHRKHFVCSNCYKGYVEAYGWTRDLAVDISLKSGKNKTGEKKPEQRLDMAGAALAFGFLLSAMLYANRGETSGMVFRMGPCVAAVRHCVGMAFHSCGTKGGAAHAELQNFFKPPFQFCLFEFHAEFYGTLYRFNSGASLPAC
ncbi:hypothetical protein DESC_190168 [Desulfosarcina cetonica]|uniref:hypothetical protein n=1 Tax=Desulfosarcina cetonica TaxID=90730 RepID=UPI0012ED0C57|nr:hypothetical protein [Desulfosarcina cetonica]VTR64551.1 hypothetical protein DESC_190168 [Desulfosarcina cetonica]